MYRTITLSALLTVFTFSMVAFYSCNKEPKGGEKFEITIHNPNNFKVRLEIEGVSNCNPGENPNYYKFSSYPENWPPAGLSVTCILPTKDGLWQQVNMGPGNANFMTDLGVKKIKIRAYKFDEDNFDKDNNPGEQVGELSFKGKYGKAYTWTVGYNNPVEEVVLPPSGGNSGGNNGGGGNSGGGDCPGADAMHYKDLMDNNPTNDCQQIWAQQAVWHAYKCECDDGFPTSAAANQMVATLNAIRKNIQDLYKSGGNPNSTKCGKTPAKVTKCKVN